MTREAEAPVSAGPPGATASGPGLLPGRLEIRDAALLALGVLAVYVLTLCPDVPGGDSGELIGAVASGGVIHPPGYPLYSLLGRLFLHVPHGSLAWRLNLMSAACAAAAAGVLCVAVGRWGRSRPAGVAAGALLAFAPGIWRYAVGAEVFALDNLFVALLLLVAVLYAGSPRPGLAMAGAALFGLGLGDHHTLVFSALPLVGWALWTGRRQLLRPRTMGLLVVCGLAGLSTYLYLPIAAARHAPVTWGTADTWSGFWTHVLRREYGTFQLASTGIAGTSPPSARLGAFASDVVEAIGPWGLALAAAGLWRQLRGARTFTVAHATVAAVAIAVGVIAVLGNLPVDDALHRGIVARFWQQPLVMVCAWCGLGVAWLGERAPAGVTLAVAGALTVVPPSLRFREMDVSRGTVVRAYGASILASAPPGALIVTRGDLITNTARYLQLSEGMRPDVKVVDQELMGFPWYVRLVAAQYPDVVFPGPVYMPGNPESFTMKQLLDANLPRAPVLSCGGLKPGDPTADGAYGRWPLGLCDLEHRGDQPVSLPEWIADSGAALPRIDFSGVPHPAGSWEDIVWRDMWQVRYTRAAHLIEVAGANPSRRQYIAMAAGWLAELVRDHPGSEPYVYKTLAIALGRSGLDTPEQRAQAAEAWHHYLAGAPPGDPQLPAIRKELERLTQSP